MTDYACSCIDCRSRCNEVDLTERNSGGFMKALNKHHLQNQIPAGAVNIMRGSIFGNPFVIGKHGDRAQVIASFKSYLWKRMQTDQPFVDAVRDLKGKDLYCCCAPKACHGDVLISACLWLNKA